MQYLKLQFGFTLVELLIVVGILLILVTMILMATGGGSIWKAAEDSQTVSILATLDSALQEYYDFWGDFPVQTPEFLGSPAEFLYYALYSTPASRKILEQVPSSMIKDTDYDEAFEPCDRWGTPLGYIYVQGRDTFPLITSAGPDRNFGTKDDIDNRK